MADDQEKEMVHAAFATVGFSGSPSTPGLMPPQPDDPGTATFKKSVSPGRVRLIPLLYQWEL